MLIDEWQRVPESWDLVRRAVDDGAPAGHFRWRAPRHREGLGTHSGAGRIVTARMRPLSIAERSEEPTSVSSRPARRRTPEAHRPHRLELGGLCRGDPPLGIPRPGRTLRSRAPRPARRLDRARPRSRFPGSWPPGSQPRRAPALAHRLCRGHCHHRHLREDPGCGYRGRG